MLQTGRQADRQTDKCYRQAGRQTGRQIDVIDTQADRQVDKPEVEIQSNGGTADSYIQVAIDRWEGTQCDKQTNDG